MKKSNKSPMTSFSSFEELAQNLEGFDYEKAKERQEFETYKRTFNWQEEYNKFYQKIKEIDECYRNLYEWKDRMAYLEGIHSKEALTIKRRQTYDKCFGKKRISRKEETELKCADFFNNFDRPEHFKDIKNEVKVGLISAEQELKETKQKANISEYSEALRITKIVAKATIDDTIDSIESYIYNTTTMSEYRYAHIASKLEEVFSKHAEKTGCSDTYTNMCNWLSWKIHKYEIKKI